ncbi:hypothetical protein LIER_11148 [Lithospermum erythrorhizon]|uniref:Alpha/beta hydrolase fold-3 domain-containing protein n=1 Tax=Lithospermum erythrorhizon TaxID=34254 RepID=A0AAV3PNP8_LITER
MVGNIVHVMAMRAGTEKLPGDVKLSGVIAAFPYFWSSEIEANRETLYYHLWKFLYPSIPGGIDNPLLNPWAKDAPSLTGLGCSKMLVVVGELDPLRIAGIQYVDEVKKSGWKGEIDLIDV